MDYTSGAVYAASGGADHLGNVRVVFGDADNNGVAEVVQDNHYYPFGMTMAIPDGYPMSGLANPFRYQGKEFQEDAFTVNGTNVNLNLYDFHARQYDPELGRWHVPDPAAQYASPYMAMGNDPVMMVDPDGMKDGPGGKRKKGDVGDLTNLGPVDIPNYNLAPSPRDLGTMIVPITSIGCTGLIWQSADGTYVYIGQTSASLAIPADGYGGGGVNPAGMGCWRGGGCEGPSPYVPPAGGGGGNGWGGMSYGNNNSNYIPDGKPTYAYEPRKPKNEVHGIVRNTAGGGVNEAYAGALPIIVAVGAALSELGEAALVGLSRLSIPFSLITLQGDNRSGREWQRREDRRGQRLQRDLTKSHNNMLNDGGVNNQGFPEDPNGLIPNGGVSLFITFKALDLYLNWDSTISPNPIPSPTIINKDTTIILVPYSPGYRP